MLFGNDRARNTIMETAQKIAKSNKFELVYAAVQGSISRGVQRYDSDYDIRFLFRRADTISVDSMRNYKEAETVIRYLPEQDLFFDKISFWDVNCFLNIAVNPRLDEAPLSCGLYNQLFWTLSSPYCWDPYGISRKILPILERHIDRGFLTNYYIGYIEAILKKDELTIRDYIYLVCAIWSIEWLRQEKSYPPLYIHSLSCICDDVRVLQIVRRYLDMYSVLDAGNDFKRKGFSEVRAEKDEFLEGWIREKFAIYNKKMDFKINHQLEKDMNSVLEHCFQIKTVKDVND